MLWRACYCLATWLALPLVLIYFHWRGRREPAYRQHWGERLGYIGSVPPHAIWVHAASVGEVVLIAPLVDALRVAYPHVPLLLTTMTPTGRAQAQTRFGDDVVHRYVSLDTRGATRRFMRATRPRLAVFAETELWPNLIGAATAANVPVAVVNASISEASAARYARWPLLHALRFMLGRVRVVGAASTRHGARFRALGAPDERIHVTGNLKYDTADPKGHEAAGRALRAAWQARTRPLWVAASTHAGEETQLLDALTRLRRDLPAVLLVVAPRHPQRFDAVAAELQAAGWRVSRRSCQQPVDAATDIVLADTLGEVPDFYAAADVAFVGGSLVAGIGGHNVLEAAAAACPLCVGPYIAEWRDIVDALVECDAARCCETPAALASAVGVWLRDSDAAYASGQAGARRVAADRGALTRTLALIDTLMSG